MEDMPHSASRLALWRSATDGDGFGGRASVRAALDSDLDTLEALEALEALDREAKAGRSVLAGARCSESSSELNGPIQLLESVL
jgi:hypothetical protein